MHRYPSKIETLIESEEIISQTDNVYFGEFNVEKIYNDKFYVIQWVCGRIRSCIVFDLNDNLIDHYDNGALVVEYIYKNKSYDSWTKP
nr:MAG: hypothetical protein [Caudoviricetes sp.]